MSDLKRSQRMMTKLKWASPALLIIAALIIVLALVLGFRVQSQSGQPLAVANIAAEKKLATSVREAAVGLLNKRDSKSGTTRLQSLQNSLDSWKSVHSELQESLKNKEIPSAIANVLEDRVFPQFAEITGQASALLEAIEANPEMRLPELQQRTERLQRDIAVYLYDLDHLDFILADRVESSARSILFFEGALLFFAGFLLLGVTLGIVRPGHRTLAGLIQDFQNQVTATQSLNRKLEDKVKQRTRDLYVAKEAAEAANSAKSTFLANMSHEIRTPIGIITGFADLLSEKDVTSEDRAVFIDKIRLSSQHLMALVSDILDLTKIEADKLDIEAKPVVLQKVLHEVTSALSVQAAQKGISFTIESDGDLPETIITDATRLKQVLLNIVGNAIKFTDEGGVKVRIRYISEGIHSGQVEFTVEDTGRGISESQKKKLFQLFSQGDSSIRKTYGGTGLGLLLSQKLAQNLGGDIVLRRSLPQHGSLFSITIDAGPIQELPAGVPQDARYAPTEPSQFRLDGMRVLVVDDLPDNLFLVDRLLKGAGAIVEATESGQEAINTLDDRDFDLILLDLRMPEMDGFETAQRIRAEGHSEPIVALTADAMKEDKEKCFRQGFSGHITKPVHKEALINEVARYRPRTELSVNIHPPHPGLH